METASNFNNDAVDDDFDDDLLLLVDGAYLQRSAAAKATRYSAVPGGFTRRGTQLVPLVHDVHNFWMDSEATCLLHHLVSVQAQHAAPALPEALGAHSSIALVKASTPLMQAVLSS